MQANCVETSGVGNTCEHGLRSHLFIIKANFRCWKYLWAWPTIPPFYNTSKLETSGVGISWITVASHHDQSRHTMIRHVTPWSLTFWVRRADRMRGWGRKWRGDPVFCTRCLRAASDCCPGIGMCRSEHLPKCPVDYFRWGWVQIAQDVWRCFSRWLNKRKTSSDLRAPYSDEQQYSSFGENQPHETLLYSVVPVKVFQQKKTESKWQVSGNALLGLTFLFLNFRFELIVPNWSSLASGGHEQILIAANASTWRCHRFSVHAHTHTSVPRGQPP
jgi:hypothetical protein